MLGMRRTVVVWIRGTRDFQDHLVAYHCISLLPCQAQGSQPMEIAFPEHSVRMHPLLRRHLRQLCPCPCCTWHLRARSRERGPSCKRKRRGLVLRGLLLAEGAE